MDAIYSMYDAIASPKIDIGKYFEKYHELIGEELEKLCHANGEHSVASFMPSSLGEEELDMLAEYCSVDSLTVPGEPAKYEYVAGSKGQPWSFERTEIPKGTRLTTLAKLEEVHKTESTATVTSLRKYTGEISIRYEKVESDGPFAVPGKDTVIYIRIYEPCRAVSTVGKKIILSSMIAVLGCQTLDKVRDLVDCISDLSIAKDISDNPGVPVEPNAKEVYKSGFFYIEGTFYNDLRDPNSRDNSEVIREWAETRNLGPFTTARMEDCRVDSLCVRFGYPWVYQHQGNCEHFIVFSDARLLNSEDELAVSAYPRIHRLKQRRCRYCMMCGISAVRWITTNSDRIPHNPCYLCDLCFKSYNYIGDKKIGNFKAYRYPDHPELVIAESSGLKGKKSSKCKKNEASTSSGTK